MQTSIRTESTLLVLLSSSIFMLTISYFSIRAFFMSLLLISVAYLVQVKYKKLLFVNSSYYIFAGINLFVVIFSFKYNLYFNFYIKFVILGFICLIMLSFFYSYTKEWVISVISIVIYLHASFFLLQLFIYITTDYYLDFDSYIRERQTYSLHLTRALEDSFINIRCGGLFSEPSFYSMNILPLTSIVLFEKKRFTPVTYFGFATVFLSFSIAAILIATLILIFYFLTHESSTRLKASLIIFTLLFSPFFYQIYDKRVNQSVDYNAIDSRARILYEFKLRDTKTLMIGEGFLWDETSPPSITFLSGAQIRDSSFYLYLLFCSGVIGTVLFLTLMFVSLKKKLKIVVLFCLCLLFKLHILNGTFLLIFFTYHYFANNTSIHNNNINGEI